MTESDSLERCYKCSAKLVPGEERCPACGASVPLAQFTESYHRRSLLWRNLRRVLVAVLSIVVVNLYWPYLNRYLPLFGVLRFSPIVTEAVNLANEHQNAVELLGKPIKLGWFVTGYIRDPELYSGESELFIPVNGPKNKGTLLARVKKREGTWIFTAANVSTHGNNSVNLFESSSDQRPRKLETSRRVYIVPLGSVPEVGLRELPQYYREKYNLSVEFWIRFHWRQAYTMLPRVR